jgi:hypothetical protein
MRYLALFDVDKLKNVQFLFKSVISVHFQIFFGIAAPRLIWLPPFFGALSFSKTNVCTTRGYFMVYSKRSRFVVITLLLRIREIPGSNLCSKPGYHDSRPTFVLPDISMPS